MQQQESPPVLAGRYELGPVLGRGGMADVHRATDHVLGREVAVKVLRETTGDEADMRRFTAEARTLAGLSHPALVMVLDAGFTDDRPFLVMDLVEGQTLAQCCTGTALPAADVARIGAQLADALAYAHERGVVHRDVKPGNVLLGPEGRVKLADFGIARLIGDTVRHTRTGHAVGTAAYLAPEQVRGDEITTAVDVYSLGLVLLEALTGERAFPGPATEAALARLHRRPEVPGSLPAPWPGVLMRMTDDDPGRRPSATEVAAVLRGQPPAVPTPRTAPLPLPAQIAGDPAPEAVTRPLTSAGSTPPADAATGATSLPGHGTRPEPHAPSRIDRAGDALAARAHRWWDATRTMPHHLKGALAAVAAIVVLLVVAALAGGGDDATDPAPADGRQGSPTQPLDEVAPQQDRAPGDSGAGEETDGPAREGWDQEKLDKWLEKLEDKRDKSSESDD